MGWVVGGAWIGAVLIAAVVLTFGLYEVSWKARRLRTEGERLQALGERAGAIAADAAALQQRVATVE